jgi:hypothetical protein
MRTLSVALLLTLSPAQDIESKKARIGEILKTVAQAKKDAGDDKTKQAEAQKRLMPQIQEMQQLLQEVAGPNREKQSALFRELMEKYIPEEAAASDIASNERTSSAGLMWINTAQAQFRAEDPDGDGVANYWVADISGLHRLRKKDGRAANLIEDRIAQADSRPTLALDTDGVPPKTDGVRLLRAGMASPRTGYLFVALQSYEDSGGKLVKYDSGSGRNTAKFGVCCYPAEYGKTGKMTYIKSEALQPVMWKKDTAGQPPTFFPADPRKEGWQPYE